MVETEKYYNILDFFAKTHTGYLHAKGKTSTLQLLRRMHLQNGMHVLEIGCGTGATLALIASGNKKVKYFGVDHSETMINAAKKRIRFSGLNNIILLQKTSGTLLPFDDNSIDIIYAESVLGIQEDENLRDVVIEMYRVLKPGGMILLNETIWMDTTSTQEIITINKFCIQAFGIIQANEKYCYSADWKKLLEVNKFEHVEISTLNESGDNSPPLKLKVPLFLSNMFSVIGKVKKILQFKSRLKYNRSLKEFDKLFGDKKYMEGFIIVARK
ncbi:MAG: class I SAM-dependent methyltransferase [Chitinophagales bacterium]